MLCFDKLKLVISTKYVKGFDKSKFQEVSLNEKTQYYKYEQKMPYHLKIRIDYEKNELVIDFTSKILGLGFINLINEDTIYECMYAIPFVEFEDDVEFLFDKFEVLKCDVTQDVSYGYNIKRLERYVTSNLKNYDKWKCENHRNGFVLKNVVTTPRYKKRLVIYNKGNELKLEKNRAFVNNVGDFDDGSFIEEYFRYKVRFELNINSKTQIRQLLGIQDNKLMSVLSSNANPILTVLNEALKEIPTDTRHICNIKDYLKELVFKDCDYSLGKVESKLKSLYAKGNVKAAVMESYRNYYYRCLQDKSDPAFDLRKLVE